MAYRCKRIAASGTFDHFHEGHRAFLKEAFAVSEKVSVFITTDKFVKEKELPERIEPFEKRKEHILQFVKEHGFTDRAEIFPLEDRYGPTLKNDTDIDAILVTKNTKTTADEINTLRQKQDLPPLKIIEIPLVTTSQGGVISSTDIRKHLSLPEHIRPLLQKPLGRLLKGSEENLTTAVAQAKEILNKQHAPFVITVGDVVTKSFNENNMPITLAIVDFKIKREEIINNLSELGFGKNEPDVVIKNPPGTISHELSEVIKKTMQQLNNSNNEPFIIRVVGEEDLAVLPAIANAPENAYIFYGQPNEGIVIVEINEKSRQNAHNLLAQFQTIGS